MSVRGDYTLFTKEEETVWSYLLYNGPEDLQAIGESLGMNPRYVDLVCRQLEAKGWALSKVFGPDRLDKEWKALN